MVLLDTFENVAQIVWTSTPSSDLLNFIFLNIFYKKRDFYNKVLPKIFSDFIFSSHTPNCEHCKKTPISYLTF